MRNLMRGQKFGIIVDAFSLSVLVNVSDEQDLPFVFGRDDPSPSVLICE